MKRRRVLKIRKKESICIWVKLKIKINKKTILKIPAMSGTKINFIYQSIPNNQSKLTKRIKTLNNQKTPI